MYMYSCIYRLTAHAHLMRSERWYLTTSVLPQPPAQDYLVIEGVVYSEATPIDHLMHQHTVE